MVDLRQDCRQGEVLRELEFVGTTRSFSAVLGTATGWTRPLLSCVVRPLNFDADSTAVAHLMTVVLGPLTHRGNVPA